MTNTLKTLDERFDEKFKIFEQVSGDNGEVEGFFAIEEDREKVKKFIRQELDNLAQQFLKAIPKEEELFEEDNAMGLNNIQNNGFNTCREEIKKNFEDLIFKAK